MSKEEKKVNRRDFLFTASYTIGAVGLGAVVWPLVHQMNPDKAQQALATTEVDISQVTPGNSITVLWRGLCDSVNPCRRRIGELSSLPRLSPHGHRILGFAADARAQLSPAKCRQIR